VTPPAAGDLSYLFHALGQVVVAGGHVEREMRHTLVRLGDGPRWDFTRVRPMPWATLVMDINNAATGRSDEAQIRAVMAVEPSLNARRNTAVHTAWRLDADQLPAVFGSRVQVKKAPYTIVASLQNFTDTAHELFLFCDQLRTIAADRHW